MKIIWQTIAKEGRHQVATYIRRKFGIKREKEFRQEVGQVIQLILQNPNIGPIDPLFVDRPEAYRYMIINGLSKIVYRINNDTIHIVGFWDCRQEPTTQAAQIK